MYICVRCYYAKAKLRAITTAIKVFHSGFSGRGRLGKGHTHYPWDLIARSKGINANPKGKSYRMAFIYIFIYIQPYQDHIPFTKHRCELHCLTYIKNAYVIYI